MWAGVVEVWILNSLRKEGAFEIYRSVIKVRSCQLSSGKPPVASSLWVKARGLIKVFTAPVMWLPMTSHTPCLLTFMQFLKLWTQGLCTCWFFCWEKYTHGSLPHFLWLFTWISPSWWSLLWLLFKMAKHPTGNTAFSALLLLMPLFVHYSQCLAHNRC